MKSHRRVSWTVGALHSFKLRTLRFVRSRSGRYRREEQERREKKKERGGERKSEAKAKVREACTTTSTVAFGMWKREKEKERLEVQRVRGRPKGRDEEQSENRTEERRCDDADLPQTRGSSSQPRESAACAYHVTRLARFGFCCDSRARAHPYSSRILASLSLSLFLFSPRYPPPRAIFRSAIKFQHPESTDGA